MQEPFIHKNRMLRSLGPGACIYACWAGLPLHVLMPVTHAIHLVAWEANHVETILAVLVVQALCSGVEDFLQGL